MCGFYSPWYKFRSQSHLSLSLPLSHTYTHPYTHSLSVVHARTHTQTISPSIILTGSIISAQKLGICVMGKKRSREMSSFVISDLLQPRQRSQKFRRIRTRHFFLSQSARIQFPAGLRRSESDRTLGRSHRIESFWRKNLARLS